jgi:hypothetical protein
MLALTAVQGWNIEIARSSLKGRLGKFHFPSASSAFPFHTTSNPMKPRNSESNQPDRSTHFGDVNQGYWPRVSDVPRRIVEMWPYVLIFISLAGFVYLFAGAR